MALMLSSRSMLTLLVLFVHFTFDLWSVAVVLMVFALIEAGDVLSGNSRNVLKSGTIPIEGQLLLMSCCDVCVPSDTEEAVLKFEKLKLLTSSRMASSVWHPDKSNSVAVKVAMAKDSL